MLSKPTLEGGHMRHKTLFRLLCKALGIYFGVGGLIGLLGNIAGIIATMLSYPYSSGTSMRSYWSSTALQALISLIELVIGLYLFFDARYVVNLAIPADHPYCPECGYDLTGNTGGLCPECGVDPQRGRQP